MPLIFDCLDRLVKTGKTDKATADKAKRMYEAAYEGLAGAMGGDAAEAAAALKAAEAMAKGVIDKKYAAALDARRLDDIKTRITANPHSRRAGAVNLFQQFETTGDVRYGTNVRSAVDYFRQQIELPFKAAMDKYGAKFAGLSKDLVGPQNMVRELFGIDSADQFTKAAADGWRKANEKAVSLAESVGKAFTAADDWRIPQFWNSERVQSFGKNEFIRDVYDELAKGGLSLRDPVTGGMAALGRREQILGDAAQKIWVGFEGGAVGASAFSPEMRIFKFADGQAGFDAWSRLQTKYGTGDDVMQTLLSHMHGQASQIGLSSIFGPSARANFTEVRRLVAEETAERNLKDTRPFLQRVASIRPKDIPNSISNGILSWFGSDAGLQRLYDTASGKADKIASTKVAAIFGGLRQYLVADQMGGALISSVPTDAWTAALAANHVGIPAANLVGRIASEFASLGHSPETTELLTQMGFVAHAVNDGALNSFRYQDAKGLAETMGKLSNIVIRASGLHTWDEVLRRAWTLEFHGMAARESEKALGDVIPPFQNLLRSYGFTEGEWDGIRSAGNIEAGPIRFFDSEGIANDDLKFRFKSMLLDQMHYGAPGAGLLERSLSADLKKGTFMGEMARTGLMYKTFPTWIVTTHLNRAMVDAAAGNLMRPALTIAGLAIPGILALQAKEMLKGNDPRAMNRADTWAAAAAQGGGLGVFGDLINNSVTRGGQTFAESAAGPVVGFAGSIAKVLNRPAREAYLGKDSTFAAGLVQLARQYVPGDSLWYTRTAVDRLLWDNVQRLVDPQYSQSFQRVRDRIKHDYDQSMWWDKGSNAPSRAPDLGSSFGR